MKPQAEWLADVANALAAWINQQPIEKDAEGNPTISPVYDAWSVLSALAVESSEPSVPLSAIRALVQQLRADADDARTRGYLEAWNTYHVCANELAALCPAPTEDQ